MRRVFPQNLIEDEVVSSQEEVFRGDASVHVYDKVRDCLWRSRSMVYVSFCFRFVEDVNIVDLKPFSIPTTFLLHRLINLNLSPANLANHLFAPLNQSSKQPLCIITFLSSHFSTAIHLISTNRLTFP